MKKVFRAFFVLTIAARLSYFSYAAEEKDTVVLKNEEITVAPQNTKPPEQKQVQVKETIPIVPAVTAPAASDGDVKQTITNYVKEQADAGGDFDIYDPQAQDTRELSFVKIGDKVGRSGEYYYACADFTDKSGNKIDLDFNVENTGGKLKVADVRIHKVNDVERFTYDDTGNRIPVAPALKAETAEKAAAVTQEQNMAVPAQPTPPAPKEINPAPAGQEQGGN